MEHKTRILIADDEAIAQKSERNKKEDMRLQGHEGHMP
jgi:hypothetical protein